MTMQALVVRGTGGGERRGRREKGDQTPGPGDVYVGHPPCQQGRQVRSEEEDHGLQDHVGQGHAGELVGQDQGHNCGNENFK